MYSEMTKLLGFSQGTMEMIVLCGIAVAVLGTILVLFWKQILAGIGLLFCFVVLANHKPIEENASVAKSVESKVSEEMAEKEMFLEDCLEFTDYSKKQCETLWDSREAIVEQDAKDAKLLDVSNKEYKKRRAEALKKHNAVVLHATYHN